MKNPVAKNEEIPQAVLRVVIIVAIVGSMVLLVTRRGSGPTNLAFDILAYVISVMAVILTTLQSIAIARQVRITRHAAAKVTEAVNVIQDLVKADKSLARVIKEDSQLDAEIVVALSKFGVGKNNEERVALAKKIKKQIKK